MSDIQMDNRTNQESSGFMEISIMDIARLLLSKLHWLLIVGVVFGAAAYFITVRTVTPMYSSYVTMYVSLDSQQGGSSTPQLSTEEHLAATYVEILKSNQVVDTIVNTVNEEGRYFLSRNQVKNMIQVGTVNKTQMLRVTVTSEDPVLACDVANAFGEAGPSAIVEIAKAGIANLVDRAEIASTPASIGAVRNAAIGFLLGMMIIGAIFVIRSIMDTTIYQVEDIENGFNVTILGQIPDFPLMPDTEKSLIIKQGETISYAEEKVKTRV